MPRKPKQPPPTAVPSDLPPRRRAPDIVPTPEQMQAALARLTPNMPPEIREKLAELRVESEVRATDPELHFRDCPPEDYAEYRQSDLWRTIRLRVRKRDGWRCRRCGTKPPGAKGLEVHHRSYAPAVLRGEDDGQLVLLCAPCHNAITLRPDGRKRTMDEQDAELLRGIAERG